MCHVSSTSRCKRTATLLGVSAFVIYGFVSSSSCFAKLRQHIDRLHAHKDAPYCRSPPSQHHPMPPPPLGAFPRPVCDPQYSVTGHDSLNVASDSNEAASVYSSSCPHHLILLLRRRLSHIKPLRRSTPPSSPSSSKTARSPSSPPSCYTSSPSCRPHGPSSSSAPPPPSPRSTPPPQRAPTSARGSSPCGPSPPT